MTKYIPNNCKKEKYKGHIPISNLELMVVRLVNSPQQALRARVQVRGRGRTQQLARRLRARLRARRRAAAGGGARAQLEGF